MKRSIIQVYTGDGKGKTSAAAGLAVRACAAGMKVYFAYFNKEYRKDIGEHIIMSKAGIETCFLTGPHPSFKKRDSGTIIDIHKKALELIKGKLEKVPPYDLIVLDEIIISLRDGFIKEEDIIALMNTKGPYTELVLTGRGCTKAVMDAADLVSEINAVKHPYKQGLKWRKGIEI